MTVLAGQMTQTPSGNAEWIPCDGRYVHITAIPKTGGTALLPRPSTPPGRGYRNDYAIRVGRWAGQRGIGRHGAKIRIPYDPSHTWFIKLEDDTADTTLTGTPPTPIKPPPGVR